MRFCSPVVAPLACVIGVMLTETPRLAAQGGPAAPRRARPPAIAPPTPAAIAPAPRKPDVIYLATKADVVARMLTMAQVRTGDVVYDLGSGDGRIVITAVRDFSASVGIGVELDATLVRQSVSNAAKAGVGDRVFFLNQSFFEADISSATVVMLYLLPAVNQRLTGKLRGLKPGTRIVSHDYPLASDWLPDQVERIRDNMLYLFTVRQRG